jgi:hypothetical protein
MKFMQMFLFFFVLCSIRMVEMASSQNLILPKNPNTQYFGRWEMSDSVHYRYSWPGVYLSCEFTGTSIGVRLADGTNYFNVYIDGKLHGVFHGTKSGEADYILAEGLANGRHTFKLSRRNITFEAPYSFCGIILDNGATLVPPLPKPARKIEFIGDSFTAAESNEATEPQLPWEARYPVTNIDKGFAPLIAAHFGAQYTTICRSGSGMVCDWQGNTNESVPKKFDRTLMESSGPKWDFKQWIPDVVIICLGLNDHSGLKDKNDNVPDDKSAMFRKTYHEFLGTIRGVYPGVKIVAVAAYPGWIRRNVKQVVDEEKASGKSDIFYSTFDEFPGGYVANGHPTIATHKKMAEQMIRDMESFDLFGTQR